MATSAILERIRTRVRENYEASRRMSIPEKRAQLDDIHGRARLAPDITVTPVRAGGVPAEWIAAPNAGGAVVLYFHGGGYIMGSLTTHRELASRIARAAAARVLLLDFRLAPEHPFPAALEDALTAYRFLLQEGVPADRIALAGDSAGGGLTLATLVALRDAGEPLPACGVTLSAFTDLAITGESIKARDDVDPVVHEEICRLSADTYLAGADPRNPLASPLYADLAGLPPLLMQVGSDEVIFDDTSRIAAKARAAGVDVTEEVYEDMFHVFQIVAFLLPEGQQAIERIGAFVRARTAREVPTTGD